MPVPLLVGRMICFWVHEVDGHTNIQVAHGELRSRLQLRRLIIRKSKEGRKEENETNRSSRDFMLHLRNFPGKGSSGNVLVYRGMNLNSSQLKQRLLFSSLGNLLAERFRFQWFEDIHFVGNETEKEERNGGTEEKRKRERIREAQ